MRCFVIGNGPSLNEINLRKLKNETTFGCNRIYLKYPEIKFGVTYYFEIDALEIFQIKDEIKRYLESSDIKYMFTLERWRNMFSSEKVKAINPSEIPFEYSNTGIVMIWKAIEMGFNPIYLVGMDLDYSNLDDNIINLGNNICKLKNNSADFFHFDKDYWKDKDEKFLYHKSETQWIIKAFREMKKYIKEKDVEIYNAGINGNANMFERISYNSLFRQ